MIRDESHNFRLRTYYVRPAEPISQLTTDFHDIEIYSRRGGEQILNAATLSANFDLWLYDLCVIR